MTGWWMGGFKMWCGGFRKAVRKCNKVTLEHKTITLISPKHVPETRRPPQEPHPHNPPPSASTEGTRQCGRKRNVFALTHPYLSSVDQACPVLDCAVDPPYTLHKKQLRHPKPPVMKHTWDPSDQCSRIQVWYGTWYETCVKFGMTFEPRPPYGRFPIWDSGNVNRESGQFLNEDVVPWGVQENKVTFGNTYIANSIWNLKCESLE